MVNLLREVSKAYMAHAVEIDSLRKTFTKKDGQLFTAVQDLTLHIPQGQVFGFLGSNGAGKTTTIKMMCGLITPTTGTIRLNGYNVQKEHSHAMRQIGAVLEGTRNIYWQLTAWQNLMYFGRLKGAWGKSLEDRAKQLLQELNLWDRRNDIVSGFSRGMQQKVAIACALVANPPIVALDEPTLGLDLEATNTVKLWISQLAKEHKKTIILTTHQLDIAEAICERIAVINKGQLIADKPVHELLRLFHEEHYQIEVEGTITDRRILADSFFEPLQIRTTENTTIITGPVADQELLRIIINRLYELKFPLISVMRTKQTLEHVFVELIKR